MRGEGLRHRGRHAVVSVCGRALCVIATSWPHFRSVLRAGRLKRCYSVISSLGNSLCGLGSQAQVMLDHGRVITEDLTSISLQTVHLGSGGRMGIIGSRVLRDHRFLTHHTDAVIIITVLIIRISVALIIPPPRVTVLSRPHLCTFRLSCHL